MTTTDPTITIAGLRAQVATLIDHLDSANTSRGDFSSLYSQHSAKVAAAEAERDALAAQLAEVRAELVQLGGADLARDAAEDRAARLDADLAKVRAELAAAPKVCAIHSYEHGPGPCMTCGAWPPGTRELIAACQTRIAGLEQAANERSRTGQMSEPERSEWIGAAVAVADALGGSLGPVSGTSGTIDPREWIHFAAGLADRAKKLAARAAKLEWERSRVADAAAESFHHGAWLRLMTAIDPNATITDDALRSLAERTTAQVTADREVARLAARVAELEARPVVTEAGLSAALDAHGHAPLARKVFAHLGPVTLPAQDRAEELAATLVGTARASMTDVPIAWSCDFADGNENARRALTNVVRTALANLSPAPAPTFDAAFLRRVMVATKHGPNGKGGPGPCDAACVKCEAELMAKAAPAREVAPTLVAVSDEDLGRAVWSKYNNADPAAWPNITIGVRAMWTAAARAVRAKLGAAEVTEERLAAALTAEFPYVLVGKMNQCASAILDRLRTTAAKGG